MDNVVRIPSDTWIMLYVMKYFGIVVCYTIKYMDNAVCYEIFRYCGYTIKYMDNVICYIIKYLDITAFNTWIMQYVAPLNI